MNVPKWLRGSASVTPHGKSYVRVWIEAPNVTAEVYITRAKARELLAHLEWMLRPVEPA